MSAPHTVAAPDVSTPGRRIAELDVLRGFALCGILVVNILQQLVGPPFPLAIDLLFVERFLSLFALLFGVGFGLFLERAAARTARPRVVLARRLWPRALLTPFTDNVSLTKGDEAAYSAQVLAQRNKGFQEIDVSFDNPRDVESGAEVDQRSPGPERG